MPRSPEYDTSGSSSNRWRKYMGIKREGEGLLRIVEVQEMLGACVLTSVSRSTSII
jgi:hypothetical protein